MKVTVLLIGVAFAATSTSFAQVFSVNAVGFVKKTVPANGLCIIAVPLNGTNNNLNTTLPLPNGFDGTTIYRFDVPTQNYLDPISWIEGFGWYSASDPSPTVNPGEGIWIQNFSSTELPISFIGEIPVGNFCEPIPGGNNLKLLSSRIPKDIPLSDIPAVDGDTIFIFDNVLQTYKDPYSYILGFGWFSANPDDPGPQGPTIPVASGFWFQGTGTTRCWPQAFTVN